MLRGDETPEAEAAGSLLAETVLRARWWLTSQEKK
jgi:hypothetical protein